MTCARCRQTLSHGTPVALSRFNGDVLCARCAERERAHPDCPEVRPAQSLAAPALLYASPCRAEEFVISIRHLPLTLPAPDRAFTFPDGSAVALHANGRPRILAYATRLAGA